MVILLDKVTEFEKYLNLILESLALEKEEKEDLKVEWNQHLIDMMHDFNKQGFSKEDSINLSIKQFGDPNLLQSEVEKSFPNDKKMQLLKEVFVWLICLIAASVGPSLFINAHYRLYFITFPLIVLILCSLLFHIIIKRFTSPLIQMLGIPIFYLCIVGYIVRNTSFDYFIKRLVSVDLGGEGLFSVAFLHLIWILLIVIRLLSLSSNKWRSIIKSSFQYWALNVSAVYLVIMLSDGGETTVLSLNVFLLYGFLHQIVDPRFLLIEKNKIKYWLRK